MFAVQRPRIWLRCSSKTTLVFFTSCPWTFLLLWTFVLHEGIRFQLLAGIDICHNTIPRCMTRKEKNSKKMASFYVKICCWTYNVWYVTDVPTKHAKDVHSTVAELRPLCNAKDHSKQNIKVDMQRINREQIPNCSILGINIPVNNDCRQRVMLNFGNTPQLHTYLLSITLSGH